MKKGLKIFGGILILALVGISFWCSSNMKDRHPGYNADLKILNNSSSELNAGFAAVAITPEVPDRWEDKNNDGKYKPKDGDSFTDGNNNGKFDPVWIAGFSNNKPANGVHDDTWARTMVMDDGKTRVAIVVLDVIGFMHDDVVDVRKMLPADLGLTYTIVASTHTHEGPDLMGMWGKSPLRSGVAPEYMQFVKEQTVKSVVTAVENLRPAQLEISQDLTGAASQVKDTRKPEVFDSGLRFIKAVDKESGATLGSLLSWGNHPETLWSGNLLVSSDFPHFFREGVEKGVSNGDSLVKQGIGGVAVFANGAVGGLMCTHRSHPITDPFTGEELLEPSFEKAAAQGNQLSLLALDAMEKPAEVIETAGISLVVRTLQLPIKNKLFKLATAIGILNRGTWGWMKMRTELAVLKIGPISLVTIPGEIYPEIVNGGVEAPEGNDFGIEPVEVPPVREMMPGKYKFVIGLANDEIGYIVPKSQWDVKAPFTYGRDSSPYGEENSPGPETAPVLHSNLMEMLKELGE
ncbi:Neutral/alkaline non-lysosomal ceramidase, N-terminal [Mariniphaga anaerophila]|uniref:Neutral/alkaline non-lysosomal ceramidase, N-terminal n=1 Tax=Mariniphaga anaerophila TaxID=1484053 RepID=A0A1M4ZWR6_9BACT|nr:neutral/alkaline non-lysosomal ceramidase N-terminal domain-containing protein [Mariniphaga anaerophila]SHF22441.1 Neutral/alkaline non-lysosomal ceramidase, N-terminal [Mariniphaga anaerophila]